MTASRRIKVLALSPYSDEGASVRFRVSQFIPHLAAAGFDVTLHPLFDTALFRLLYKPGRVFRKASALLSRTLDRRDVLRDRQQYDLVFIHREAYPIGPPLFERSLQRRGVPVIYDFDDAVFLPNTSDANRMIGFLKNPGKVREIVGIATEVMAGNAYLADYARKHARSVSIVPTCVDTDIWRPRAGARPAGPPVIGWIGTPTTTPYLLGLRDVLAELARSQEFILRVSGSVEPVVMPGVRVENVPWSLPREIELFNSCDVGVYPMPDDAWTRGKCGFKAIQFMACAVPVVASPVGVNREIVEHGISGLLASTPADWLAHLTTLLTDADSRRRIGAAGRGRIEAEYSLQATAPKLVAVFERAARAVGHGGR